MQYCQQCILPDTRPNLTLNAEGVCNGCLSHATKEAIDWQQREHLFQSVVAHAKSKAKGYDCIVPVSGGKDSTWQIVRCLEYGLKPLAVTWKSPARTAIGQKNLDNLVSLGVDHIDYQINPKVERVFMRKAFERYGSTAIPMHMALFNIPLSLALRFDIPLVVWGENSAFEYGGTAKESTGFELDDTWLKKYGVTHGTRAEDWMDQDLSAEDLVPYLGPTAAELKRHKVLAVFLGYYFPWDPTQTLAVAQDHGFQGRAEGPKTGYYDYADIDDDFISIHHFLKWFKFGFTRSYDNLSLEIRNGRLSRDEAIAWLIQRGDETPHEDIQSLCAFLEISQDSFWRIVESFRNEQIWKRKEGVWKLDNFLIENWPWRADADSTHRTTASI